ncbi:S49 family peptidase [Brevundimonas sp.]|uniref:S49 family peptidase n=1 Tax=Brevundimonas sp. TaxID=1871086 RepID=UPI0028A0A4AA|nr:S49 family peptidase [Brevundimonas sp.]
MRNPAQLAAALSGRPLLMREASIPALARQLGLEASDRGSPLANFFGRARRALASREDVEERTEPLASSPRFVGEPDDVGYGWVLKDGVGILEVSGPLMAEGFGWGDVWYHGYDTLFAAYEEMFADARVGAIWEVVRSPGGVVDQGLPELAALKRENRASAGGKPIHAFLRDGYSAAYWEPSAADHIVAARESGVGSIGAVVTHCDFSGAFAKDGIVITPFKFGAKKTDGSWMEPLSETASQGLQDEIDQCGRWFVADVLAGRPNLTEEEVLATEAGCFFGDSDNPQLSALAKGLVDEIATERKAFAAIRELARERLASSNAAPAPAASTEETDMKRSAVLAAAKTAGLTQAAIKALSEALPKAGTDDTKPDDSEDDDDGGDDDEGDEKPKDQVETGDEDDQDDKKDDAAAIAASAEAKKNPALALAAIQSGQTLAQFKASAAVAGSAQGGSRLDRAMSGTQRLRADGAKGATGMSAAVANRIDRNRGGGAG